MVPTPPPPWPRNIVDSDRPDDAPTVQSRLAFRDLLESLPDCLRLPGRTTDVLVSRSRVTYLRAGRPLFLPGQGRDSLRVVVSGAVRVIANGPAGTGMFVRIVPPGWILAPMSSSAGRCTTVSFTTHVPSAVATLPWRHAAVALAGIPPDLALRLAGTAFRVLAEVILEKCQLLTMPLRDRLLREFRVLAQDFGRKTVDGVLIDLPLAQGHLAKLVVAGRSSVCRTLGVLRDEGAISYDDDQLVVHEPGEHPQVPAPSGQTPFEEALLKHASRRCQSSTPR